MIRTWFAAALAVASLAAASTAFASGYGPAPHYDPLAGAPASQRGQSAQTLHAEAAQSMAAASYGTEGRASSESGARMAWHDTASVYAHH
ncbi:hypothetical protein [Burkholderia sp. Ac-20379]|uniref:hypothetical protein n=1 Tax=Burkholderia sp. Ac-20379 TaxID=2703900 RepID=UPI00197FB9F1|nr:hypothetical protein [Burkholderia sp. Ac-20379]MBN3728275.1 hypothetical protein [Burkholderia sp. Ac-20379]